MKLTTLILSTAVILGSTVCMAQQKQLPVQVTVENAPNVYKPETIAVRKAIRIHNQHGFFSVRALLTKPNAKLQQERKVQLDCGNYGFSAHVSFLTLTVNGITDRKLQLKAEDMVAWQDGDKKGGSLLYNFDGAKLRLYFYMRPDSPVIWFRIVPEKSVTPYKSIRLDLNCIISNILKKNGKVVFQGGYQRKAQTAARTIDQAAKYQDLTAADKYIAFYDLINDGSAKDKGQGPCLIVLGNTPVKSAKLGLTDDWKTNLRIELPLDFKEYTVGLWQPRQGMSNNAFFEKFKKEQSAFTLK
jgi:hypothetical protein